MSRAVGLAALAVMAAAVLLAWQALAPHPPASPGAVRPISDGAAPTASTTAEAIAIEPALARPPFSPGRRPPSAAASSLVAAEAPVPVAIASTSDRRIVLLRVPGIERLVRARAGDRVGGWQVRDVLADRVTLLDPAGKVHDVRLRPPPAATPRAAEPPAATPSSTGAEVVGIAEETVRAAASSP